MTGRAWPLRKFMPPRQAARRVARRRGRRRGSSADAGFTLVEMLVAVAVLAILAALVPRSLVSARSVIDHSQEWQEARLVAETVLNDQLASNKLTAGVLSGTLDGRRWTAVVRQDTALSRGATRAGRALLHVRVQVPVPGGSQVEVETMRIGSDRK